MIRITIAAAVETRMEANALCAAVFGTFTQETPVFSETVWRGDDGLYCVASLDVPDALLIDLVEAATQNGLVPSLWIVGDEAETPRASTGTLCLLAGLDSRHAIHAMGLTPPG